MKSIISVIVLCILVIFVTPSEANTEEQINERMSIRSGGYKVWLDQVTGFDKNDAVNGYAGIFGKPITSLRISGNQRYSVHTRNRWLDSVSRNDQHEATNGYAGTVNGDPIDAVAIDGGVEYTVHIPSDDRWLPIVTKYDTSDFYEGFAGILGEPIDAVMIKGRTYAVSYTDSVDDTDISGDMYTSTTSIKSNTTDASNLCIAQGGSCMNPNICTSAYGIILNEICPNENSNYKCCVPKNSNSSINQTNSNSNSILITIFIIIATLAIIIITATPFYLYNQQNKNNKNQQQIPVLPPDYPNRSPTININELPPPGYPNPSPPININGLPPPGYPNPYPTIKNNDLPPPYPYPVVVDERHEENLEYENIHSNFSKSSHGHSHSEIRMSSTRQIENYKSFINSSKSKDFIIQESSILINKLAIKEAINEKDNINNKTIE